jgi:hypothetical protein
MSMARGAGASERIRVSSRCDAPIPPYATDGLGVEYELDMTGGMAELKAE